MAARVWDEETAREIIGRLAALEGADASDPPCAAGRIRMRPSGGGPPLIADALNLSRAEAHGVVAFYHDVRAAPAGRRVVRICRAEACQANGVEALLAELRARRGLAPDGPSDDKLTFETVYCLGNCALGPNALVDGEIVARLDADRLAALCDGASIGRRADRCGRDDDDARVSSSRATRRRFRSAQTRWRAACRTRPAGAALT